MTRTAGTRPGPQARRAAAGRGAPRYVTIVHSDIVASTELVAAAGPGYPRLLARHRRLIASAVRRFGGRFLSHAGDGTLAVFDEPVAALAASVEAQRALGDEPWPAGLAPGCGWASTPARSTTWPASRSACRCTRAPRIMAVAAAGQVVVSDAVVEAMAARAGPSLADRRVARRPGPAAPVRLHQVVADGLTVVVPRRGHLSSVA